MNHLALIFVCAWLEPSKIEGCKCCKCSSKTTWAHVFFPKQWAQRSTYRVYAPDLPPKMAVKRGLSQICYVYIQSRTDPWSTRHPNTFLDPPKKTYSKTPNLMRYDWIFLWIFCCKGKLWVLLGGHMLIHRWYVLVYVSGCSPKGTQLSRLIVANPTFPFDCCKRQVQKRIS